MQIRRLTWMGILVALSIVLTRLFSLTFPIGGTTALRLGFGPVPIIMAGILMGPVEGLMVGAVADLLGFVLNPMGGLYLPDFTVISMLSGVLPAIMYKGLRKRLQPRLKVLLAVLFSQVATALVLTPIVLLVRFKIPLAVTLPMRLVAQAILIPAYSMMIWIIGSRIASLFPDYFPQFKGER